MMNVFRLWAVLFVLAVPVLAGALGASEQDKMLISSLNLGDANSLGLRFSNGFELSHQRLLECDNQLEFSFGFSDSHCRKDFDLLLNAAYQWVFPVSGIDELQWYSGAVLHSGCFDIRSSADFNLGLGGQLGIAYIGAVPFQFTLDLRPVYYLLDGRQMEMNIGLGVRYLLGQ